MVDADLLENRRTTIDVLHTFCVLLEANGAGRATIKAALLDLRIPEIGELCDEEVEGLIERLGLAAA